MLLGRMDCSKLSEADTRARERWYQYLLMDLDEGCFLIPFVWSHICHTFCIG